MPKTKKAASKKEQGQAAKQEVGNTNGVKQSKKKMTPKSNNAGSVKSSIQSQKQPKNQKQTAGSKKASSSSSSFAILGGIFFISMAVAGVGIYLSEDAQVMAGKAYVDYIDPQVMKITQFIRELQQPMQEQDGGDRVKRETEDAQKEAERLKEEEERKERERQAQKQAEEKKERKAAEIKEKERKEKERQEAEEKKQKLEKERIEKERKEAEKRKEKERLEKERFEKEKLEKERLEKEKLEKVRKEKERLENERLEKKRQEKEKLEKERQEKEKVKLEKERLEKERKEKLEKERLKKEKQEKERLEKEKEKLEKERQENERKEKKKLEKERLKKERQEKEKLEKEKEKLENERLEKERLENEKIEKEKKEKEKLEKERKEAEESRDKDRKEKQEKLEMAKKEVEERKEKERLEQERKEAEEEREKIAQKAEIERKEKERKEAEERSKKERLEREEMERKEKKRLEKERKEAEEKKEKERQAQKAETERKEKREAEEEKEKEKQAQKEAEEKKKKVRQNQQDAENKSDGKENEQKEQEKSESPKKDGDKQSWSETEENEEPVTMETYEMASITNAADFEIRDQLDEADALFEEEDFEAAIKKYDQILLNHGVSPRAMYGKGLTLDMLGFKHMSNEYLEEAINFLGRLIFLMDVPDDLYMRTGRKLAERQHFRGWGHKAIQTYKLLIERFPEDLKLRCDFGVGYMMIGQNERAQDVFNEVMMMDPDNGFAKVHMGFILKTKGEDLEKAIPLLREGIESREEGTIDGRFYVHLGDALLRVGKEKEARHYFKEAATFGLFLSEWQRSLYNVKELTGRPFWTPEQMGYQNYVKLLEDNWKVIRDEGLAQLDAATSSFVPEEENLMDTGDWKQFTLYQQGRKNQDNCANAPKTCAIIDQIAEAKNCKRGQVKFSVMSPGIHVWPHTGPTNCRVRGHLGLVVPEGPVLRVVNETRLWKEGKMMFFDDSFEHEVWHEGSELRLILIVDFWHPELTEKQRRTLSPI